MASIPTYYYQHLENILDRLNEDEFSEPLVQDYGDKGSVTFAPAPAPVDPNTSQDTGRPDRVTGGRQNRQPA
jgi:hypothetical protein